MGTGSLSTLFSMFYDFFKSRTKTLVCPAFLLFQNIADYTCANHLTRLTDERIAGVRIRYAEQQTALLCNAGKFLGFLSAERKRLVAYNVDVMLKKALCNLVLRIVCRHDGDSIAPQRWNLPMYEPSPPPIIPNFSINNYSLHFTYQSLRPLPFPRSVMRSLHPRCSRLQSRPCCPDLRSAQCRADG